MRTLSKVERPGGYDDGDLQNGADIREELVWGNSKVVDELRADK